MHGALNNVKLLMDYGADLLAQDSGGLTALDLAEQGEHQHCMEVLRKAAGKLKIFQFLIPELLFFFFQVCSILQDFKTI